MHVAVMVHTNNGIEAQNKAFKHDYLQPFKSKSLSNMLTCLVDGFLVDSYRRSVLLYSLMHFRHSASAVGVSLPAPL